MPVKFNPFTGQLQIDEKGSGGGSSYIDGEVATYNDLPLDGTAALNSAWLVREASGVWPVSRKQAGIYIRTAAGGSSRDADFTYAGTMPDVFSDAVLTIYDEASTTRTGQFNLGSITAGQNRVLTWPDGNGTIARTSDIPSTFAASAITSGVFDNARINFAAPSAIGSTTASTGAFTTLNANNGTITASAPVLDLSQTWNNSGVTFTAFRLNATNTNSSALSLLADFQVGGTTQFSVRRDGVVACANRINLLAAQNGLEVSHATNGASPVRYTADTGGTGNCQIRPSGNVIEQIGTTATSGQSFRVYNTFTDSNNHERLRISWSSNTAIVGTEKAGTGSARGLNFQTDGTNRLTIGAAGTLTLNTTLAADAQNISTDTTTGTKIGTGTTQKIGFFNATPVVQQAAVADATDAASTQARLNDLLARLRTLGLIAT